MCFFVGGQSHQSTPASPSLCSACISISFFPTSSCPALASFNHNLCSEIWNREFGNLGKDSACFVTHMAAPEFSPFLALWDESPSHLPFVPVTEPSPLVEYFNRPSRENPSAFPSLTYRRSDSFSRVSHLNKWAICLLQFEKLVSVGHF